MSTPTLLDRLPRVERSEPVWLAEKRAAATGRFNELGLPTRRVEAYKYTDLRPLLDMDFGARAGAAAADVSKLAEQVAIGLPQILVVDGVVREDSLAALALPEGITIRPLREAIAADLPVVREHLGSLHAADQGALPSLNLARFEDGLLLHAASGAKLSQPVQIVQVTTGEEGARAAFPRHLVVAEEDSELRFVTAHVGPGGEGLFVCGVKEVLARKGSRVEIYRLQEDGPGVRNLSHLVARLEERAQLFSFDLSSGGLLSRHDVHVDLAGEHARAELSGLYLGNEREQRDVCLRVDHRVPHCESDQLFRGVMDGASTGTFNGTVIVREGADHTDAQQSNKSLLVSPDAHAHTRPQLEIYADEVSCSHGATVGQIDEDALFYLRSRGMTEAHARSLLTRAFAREVLEKIPDGELVPHIEDVLTRVLHLAQVPAGEL